SVRGARLGDDREATLAPLDPHGRDALRGRLDVAAQRGLELPAVAALQGDLAVAHEHRLGRREADRLAHRRALANSRHTASSASAAARASSSVVARESEKRSMQRASSGESPIARKAGLMSLFLAW